MKTLDLPFPPRKQLLIRNDSKLIVADAFGGRLAVVEVASGKVESVRALPAHNIRGLAQSPDGMKLFLAHQDDGRNDSADQNGREQSGREKLKALDRMNTGLETKLGRPPTEHELAENLGISIGEVGELMVRMGRTNVYSLDDILASGKTLAERALDALGQSRESLIRFWQIA